MVMETITKVVTSLGASDIDERLEIRLVDGIIYAFQEQTSEDQVMLDGFGTVVNALGKSDLHMLTGFFLLSCRHPCETISHTNCDDGALAPEQQERQSATASRGPNNEAGSGYQTVRRGSITQQGMS